MVQWNHEIKYPIKCICSFDFNTLISKPIIYSDIYKKNLLPCIKGGREGFLFMMTWLAFFYIRESWNKFCVSLFLWLCFFLTNFIQNLQNNFFHCDGSYLLSVNAKRAYFPDKEYFSWLIMDPLHLLLHALIKYPQSKLNRKCSFILFF